MTARTTNAGQSRATAILAGDAGRSRATALLAGARRSVWATALLAATAGLACQSPGGGAPAGTAAPEAPVVTGAPSPPSASATESPAPPEAPSADATAGAPAGSGAADAAPSAAPSATAAAAAGPCPEGMLRIAGGTLRRHKPGAKKGPFAVPSYCLDRTEVTVAAYKACVKEKKCSPRCLEIGRCSAVPTDADWPDPMEAGRASMFCNGSRSDRDEHPVNCVSFDEANGYCQSRGKRLPTGDEWEWAAMADKPSPMFPWGPMAPDGEQLCWGRPYKRPSTCLPGTFAKDTTRDGVVDMAGNLSEWVIEGTPESPRRRLRGSSWYAIDDGYIQASLYGFESTSTRSEVFGFRCAKDLSAP